MRDALASQDYLYTLVEREADGGMRASVIGSIIDFLLAADDPEAVVQQMAAPNTRIVSLTITEGGYNTNFVTGEFNLENPEIAADLTAPASELATPFGLITEALARRREAGQEPFTILSCDNIQANGRVAKNALLAFATAKYRELADWIRNNVSFPSSMVDRITPMTTPQDQELVASQFGIIDAWPVACEPFFQWAIEDDFVNGRPPLEQAGVQFAKEGCESGARSTIWRIDAAYPSDHSAPDSTRRRNYAFRNDHNCA